MSRTAGFVGSNSVETPEDCHREDGHREDDVPLFAAHVQVAEDIVVCVLVGGIHREVADGMKEAIVLGVGANSGRERPVRGPLSRHDVLDGVFATSDPLCLGLGAVARASGWTRGRVG